MFHFENSWMLIGSRLQSSGQDCQDAMNEFNVAILKQGSLAGPNVGPTTGLNFHKIRLMVILCLKSSEGLVLTKDRRTQTNKSRFSLSLCLCLVAQREGPLFLRQKALPCLHMRSMKARTAFDRPRFQHHAEYTLALSKRRQHLLMFLILRNLQCNNEMSKDAICKHIHTSNMNIKWTSKCRSVKLAGPQW